MMCERPIHNLLFLLTILINKVAGNFGKQCSITELYENACSLNETCELSENSVVGVCKCIPGYAPVADKCVNLPDNRDVEESHTFAWTFASLILVAFVIIGVYFSYKLRVVSWLKYKLNQRYHRSYDDVMIGQDEE